MPTCALLTVYTTICSFSPGWTHAFVKDARIAMRAVCVTRGAGIDDGPGLAVRIGATVAGLAAVGRTVGVLSVVTNGVPLTPVVAVGAGMGVQKVFGVPVAGPPPAWVLSGVRVEVGAAVA